ncbi:MAG: hypothetical protein HKN44_14285 [Ilumatobacter sp.]|nr:hypothetical protein [Ilumatobacter sp.]
MAKLVLLVVAAAWAAVLIPPMLRSRVDNRPNSSVSDFRRQLNKLQSTATPARGSVRAMGRPLTQSPLQRHAAGGRPNQMSQPRQSASRHNAGRHTPSRGGTATRQRPVRDVTGETARYRSHGDPSGGQRRPDEREPRGAQRQARPVDPMTSVKRRRMNVLFILVITAASTMFLAATTQSSAMLWAFGLSFLGLCGYIYVLAQVREREDVNWGDGWFDQR